MSTQPLDPGGAEGAGTAGAAAAAAPSGSELVDWDLAAAAGRRLVPAGPKATPGEVAALVAELRTAAGVAVDPVATTSLLQAPAGAPAPLVVDRAGWIRANAASMRAMLGPVLDTVVERQRAKAAPKAPGGSHRATVAAAAWSGAVTGTELAGMLAWVSTKVLGQYDLAPQGDPKLLLVAPNVLQAERDLAVDPSDFRRWVCLHEETHRVQFTAVPWLRDHIIDSARRLGTELVPGPDQGGERLQQVLSNLPGVVRGDIDITALLATPQQRAELARITAVMSLLEGHADVIMDDVGPSVIPTVAVIRRKFESRRKGAGSLDRVLRRLLGMDAKMRQYRDGAVFVRAVVDRVGRADFNTVWSSPETLPLPEEIVDPSRWVTRVLG